GRLPGEPPRGPPVAAGAARLAGRGAAGLPPLWHAAYRLADFREIITHASPRQHGHLKERKFFRCWSQEGLRGRAHGRGGEQVLEAAGDGPRPRRHGLQSRRGAPGDRRRASVRRGTI
ncbi:unnamed protein product, partial [Prorocentrum cordatum]